MVVIVDDENKRTKAEQARPALSELANVKQTKVVASKQAAGFRTRLALDYSKVGPKVKSKLAALQEEVKRRERDIADEILATGRSKVTVGTEAIELTPEDLVVSFVPPEGKVTEEEHGVAVLLDTARDEQLIAEGLVRDVARRVQMTRKMAGLNPTEVLNTVYVAGLDDESKGLVYGHLRTLAYLVRSREVKLEEKIPKGIFTASHTLDDAEVTVGFRKPSPKRRAIAKRVKSPEAEGKRRTSRGERRVRKTK
jgi:hypothetical protein